jgi:heme exporter protein B
MTQANLGQTLGALVQRDFKIAYRNRGELANPLLFYIIVMTLFAFGVGPDPAQLREVAPGIIWVAALLATLLALNGLFRSDFEDGSLEQLIMSAQPIPILLLGKVMVHWSVTGLPLLLITPFLAMLMHLDGPALGVLLLSLLVGTPILSLIGSVGGALTVGVRRGSLLLALIVLPLYIPVLIFGTSAVQAAASGLPVAGQIYLLSSMLVLALTLTPIAAAAALRISVN